MRDKMAASLAVNQVEAVEKLAKDKKLEDWAQEILN
jgi:hypothetical protein